MRYARDAELRQFLAQPIRPAVDRRLDRARHLRIAEIGPNRIQCGIVELTRSLGRGVEEQGDLLQLARHHRPVARRRRRDPRGGRAGGAQPEFARDAGGDLIGLTGIGDVEDAGEGIRVRRGQLDQRRSALDGRRDQHDRTAGTRGGEQHRARLDAFLARTGHADVALRAKQRQRRGFIGQAAGTGFEQGGFEIDALGLRPHRTRKPCGHLARAGFVGTVEQIKAHIAADRVDRAA